MEEIIEPNDSFPFDRLTLAKPTIIAGGNYFIKFLVNGNPLYIQPPKCLTKQGIAKAGKRFYCDFVYKNENEAFIQWIERLENFSQKTIFENREKWFETELDMHDIENSFTSPLKIYKSGKSYVLRTNIPARLGKCSLKIYDEDEADIDPETVKDNTQVITILEVQGIKCSARSFQIEIEAKQMMILKPSKLFDKCILTGNFSKDTIPKTMAATTTDLEQMPPIPLADPVLSKELDTENISYDLEDPTMDSTGVEPVLDKIVTPNIIVSANGLDEIELTLDDVPETETVQLHNRKEVYYKMYREAKNKAKIAKDLALSSYLEAKRIKNTYMLDDLSDDSDDSDYEEDEDDEENNDDDDGHKINVSETAF